MTLLNIIFGLVSQSPTTSVQLPPVSRRYLVTSCLMVAARRTARQQPVSSCSGGQVVREDREDSGLVQKMVAASRRNESGSPVVIELYGRPLASQQVSRLAAGTVTMQNLKDLAT